MFHEVDPEAFERHIRVLKARYNLVSLRDYLAVRDGSSQHDLPAKPLLITIDDGHKSNYRLLPVIKQHGVPLTVFICSGVVGTRRHFWFMSGLPCMTIERLKEFDDSERLLKLREVGFDEEQEHQERQALSREEILEMKEFVDFQAHTVFHPILPKCDNCRAGLEIGQCKSDLESAYGLSIHSLSYPNGDYGEREVELARVMGYRCAFTVDYGFNTLATDPFRLKRIYVSGDASESELVIKASGVWTMVRDAARFVKKCFWFNPRQ